MTSLCPLPHPLVNSVETVRGQVVNVLSLYQTAETCSSQTSVTFISSCGRGEWSYGRTKEGSSIFSPFITSSPLLVLPLLFITSLLTPFLLLFPSLTPYHATISRPFTSYLFVIFYIVFLSCHYGKFFQPPLILRSPSLPSSDL